MAILTLYVRFRGNMSREELMPAQKMGRTWFLVEKIEEISLRIHWGSPARQGPSEEDCGRKKKAAPWWENPNPGSGRHQGNQLSDRWLWGQVRQTRHKIMEATYLKLNPRNIRHLVWKDEAAGSRRSRSKKQAGRGKEGCLNRQDKTKVQSEDDQL